MNEATNGIVVLEALGLLHFAGADAQAFLHGQLSCDVNNLSPGQATYGSYNTPKGRMLATFLLWRDESGFTMQLPRSLRDAIRRRLTMYVLRAKVTVTDLSETHDVIGIIGANAIAELAKIIANVPSAPLAVATNDGTRIVRLDIARCLVVMDRQIGGSARDALIKNLPAVSQEDWNLADIRAGVPYITPPTQDQFVPQMANLDLINGVSFNKGCYPGQEIVARMHYLGRLKQRMYLVRLHEPAQPGDKLYSPATGEQATGMIVNSAPAPHGGQLALAVMHIESFAGGEVHLHTPGGSKLEFLDLPYPIPSAA